MVGPNVVKAAPYPAMPAYYNPIGNAALNQQATQMVNSKLNPLIAQVQKQYQDLIASTGKQYATEQANRTAGINASMQGWLNALQTPEQVNAYDTQQLNAQQGINNALQSFLSQQGQATMGGLQQQAQAAGASPGTTAGFQGGATPLNVGGINQSGQAVQAATGAGALTALNQQRQADVAAAGAQPGLVHGYGADQLAAMMQDVATRRGTALSDIANQQSAALGQITAQAPGLISDTLQSLLDRELTKAQARATYGANKATYLQGINTTNADYAQARKLQNAAFLQDLLKTSNAAAAKATANKLGFHFAGGHIYTTDPLTGTVTDTGVTYPVPKKGGGGGTGPGGTSKSQQISIDKKADDIAYRFYNLPKTTKQVNVGTASLPQYKTVTVPGGHTANLTAYQGVVAWYLQNYPKQSPDWIVEKARRALVGAHYTKANDALKDAKTYIGILNDYASKAGKTREAAKATQQARQLGGQRALGLLKPGTTTAATQPRGPGGPVVDQGPPAKTQKTPSQTQKTPQQAGSSASTPAGLTQGVKGTAQKVLKSKTGQAIESQAKSAGKGVANWAAGTLPGGIAVGGTKAAAKVAKAIVDQTKAAAAVTHAQNAIETNALGDLGERIKSGQWQPKKGMKPQDESAMAGEMAQYLLSKYKLTSLRARQLASVAIFNASK